MRNENARQWLLRAALFAMALGPVGLLLLLSTGTGWTFPNVAPDRLDFGPWRSLVREQQGILSALGTSSLNAMVVGVVATVSGLLTSRSLRRLNSPGFGRALAYGPFVLSPIIVGVCFYDLFARIGLAGNSAGVVVAQSLFATAFATVIFGEFWDSRTDATEQLVRMLGGSAAHVWRHAVLPRGRGLIGVCLVQTALLSWLDYGLASYIGGGRVGSLTVLLFGYIREGSVNLAALASLLLLLPALIGLALTAAMMARKPRATA